MSDLNPRVLRDHYAKFVGKKVMIGTNALHYVSGTVLSVAGKDVNVTVNGRTVTIAADAIATIQEVSAMQADYIK